MSVSFGDIEVGLELAGLAREVTQEKIVDNAIASLDYNPIHLDPVYTERTMVLGETPVAHGMMTLSHMASVVTGWCYESGAIIRKLDGTLTQPVRPGDVVSYSGRVAEKHFTDERNGWVVVALRAENQRHETVGVAQADVVFPGGGPKYKGNL